MARQGSIGLVQAQAGNLSAAKTLLQADSADSGDTQFALALIHDAGGDEHLAFEAIDQACRFYKRNLANIRGIHHYVPEFFEQQQRKAFVTLGDSLALAIRHSATDSRWAERAASWMINYKALGSEDLARRAELLRTGDAKLAAELNTVRNRISSMTVGDAPRDQEELRMWESRERTLMSQVRFTKDDRENFGKWHEIDDIRRQLPPESVFLTVSLVPLQNRPLSAQLKDLLPLERTPETEFVAADIPGDSLHYVACAIPAEGRGEVSLIDLGKATTIDAVIGEFRIKMNAAPSRIQEVGERDAELELQEPLSTLSKLILAPVEESLANTNEILLCPDSALWLVPYSALLDRQGNYLVESRAVRFLVSGRELITRSGAEPKLAAPLVFADPDFDLDYRSLPANLNQTAATTILRTANFASRRDVARLPGTAVEAQAIQASLTKFAQRAPQVLQRRDATVDAIKRARRPRVLVVSTHAYFDAPEKVEPPSSAIPPAESPWYDPHKTRHRKLMEPLLGCGLLLAGCNDTRKHARALNDDGVLTGLEIVGMDLQGTELVVLSACETGVGVPYRGESAVGLRHSFQIAGAQAVVSTLWRVDDSQTTRLVSDMFASLSQGLNKSEALHQAQLSRLQARRDRNNAGHPFYWAGFTLTGNR